MPVPVEGLGPAEGRADFSEDFWRGWVADLSDAELATLHAIVEEQQAKKKVVPKAKAKAAPTLAEARRVMELPPTPRCLDGSRDMRFKVNWGFDKYDRDTPRESPTGPPMPSSTFPQRGIGFTAAPVAAT